MQAVVRLSPRLWQNASRWAEALGVRFNVSIEDRINGAAAIIGHKPSTRQDIEMGRPLEIDPLVTAVIELADRLDITVPTLKHVSGLLMLQAETLGLYKRIS